MVLPDAAAKALMIEQLRARGVAVDADALGFRLRDPWGTPIRIMQASFAYSCM